MTFSAHVVGTNRRTRLPMFMHELPEEEVPPAPVTTYHLPWPELASLRGEELDMTQGTAAILYRRFNQGDGQTPADRKRLAVEIGKHRTTVDYHYDRWEKAGCPDPDAPAESPEAVDADQPLQEEAAQLVAVPAEEEPRAVVVDSHTDERPDEPTIAKQARAGRAEVMPPVVGDVVEGAVDRVEAAYALVNLVGCYDPASRKWIRGKVSVSQILRQGFCADARDWLAPGDMVYAKVLNVEESSGRGLTRWRVDLSTKQAPAHPRERIPLESDVRERTAPVTARGADVSREIGDDMAQAYEAYEARRHAKRLVRAHRLAPCHVDELATRVLTNGLETTTQELEADLERLAELKAECKAPAPAQVAAAVMVDPDAAAETEGERLDGLAVGLCLSCVHYLDGFCPYPDFVTDTYDIPDEDLPVRHQGRRIHFGRRPVIECDLYRGEGA